MTETLLKLLGLPAGAGEDDIIATITSCQTAAACVQDLGELLGVEATASGVRDAVVALKEAEAAGPRRQDEVDRLKADRLAAGGPEGAGEPQGPEPVPAGGESNICSPGDELLRPEVEAGPTASDLSAAELMVVSLTGISPEQFRISRESLAARAGLG